MYTQHHWNPENPANMDFPGFARHSKELKCNSKRGSNEQPHDVSDNHVVMTCTSWEKGTWEYELIETEEPFDQSKLEFYLYHIDGMFIVDHLKYEGEELTCIDGSTRGVGFKVWFN